jgi:hypothetical protein
MNGKINLVSQFPKGTLNNFLILYIHKTNCLNAVTRIAETKESHRNFITNFWRQFT